MTDASAATQPDKGSNLSPAQRQQLQRLFDHANRTHDDAMKKGGAKTNFDYANDLYSQCVLGDPGNIHYIKALLDNLYAKAGPPKKQGKLSSWFGGSSKAGLKKISAKGDWLAVLKAGLACLKATPYDAEALIAMAEASEKLKHFDAQLAYLKAARRAAPRNPDINRTCADALTRRGRFDDAIECWRRVAEADPSDEKAEQMIAKLAVDKTIKHGNYEQAESTTDTMADKQAQAERKGEAEKVTPEQKFRAAIAANPSDLNPYLELSEILTQQDRHEEAEPVLTQALQISGGDMKIREYLEDCQMRVARNQVRVAERRAAEDKTEEAKQLAQQMLGNLNRLEIQVFSSRVDRYPANTGLKYELGLRLRRGGNYNEAIKILQQARNDPKKKGQANLELGDCFRMIKQYPLAVQAYEAALEALPPKEDDARKQAMYWAGKVALAALRDYEKAEKHLNALAGVDFNYKDLAALLDKLTEMRNNG